MKHGQDASGYTFIFPPVQKGSLPIHLSPQILPGAKDKQEVSHGLRRLLGPPPSQDQRMPSRNSVER